MQLIEFDVHDHPDRHPGLPAVGCAICGHQVQAQPGVLVANKARHVDGLPPAVQGQMLEALSAWSHKHAGSHTEAELREHHRQQLPAPELPEG